MKSSSSENTIRKLWEILPLRFGGDSEYLVFDDKALNARDLLTRMVYEPDSLKELLNAIRHWDHERLLDLHMVITGEDLWDEPVPFELLAQIFLRLKLEDYDPMLDSFYDCPAPLLYDEVLFQKVKRKLDVLMATYQFTGYWADQWNAFNDHVMGLIEGLDK